MLRYKIDLDQTIVATMFEIVTFPSTAGGEEQYLSLSFHMVRHDLKRIRIRFTRSVVIKTESCTVFAVRKTKVKLLNKTL